MLPDPNSLPKRPYEILQECFGLSQGNSAWLRRNFKGPGQSFPTSPGTSRHDLILNPREPDRFPHEDRLVALLLGRVWKDESYHWESVPDKTTAQNMLKDAYVAAFRRDPLTGAYTKDTGKYFMDVAYEYLKSDSKHTLACVEVDFSNMAGANKAIGREKVNRALRIMKNMYTECLTETPQVLALKYELLGVKVETKHRDSRGNLTTIRTGGDEMRFLVTGLDAAEIRERLRWAQELIRGFTSQLCLDTLRHTKYPDEPLKAGFGSGCGFFMLNEAVQSPETLQQLLDKSIDESKFFEGLKRNIGTEQVPGILEKQLSPREQDVMARISSGAAGNPDNMLDGDTLYTLIGKQGSRMIDRILSFYEQRFPASADIRRQFSGSLQRYAGKTQDSPWREVLAAAPAEPYGDFFEARREKAAALCSGWPAEAAKAKAMLLSAVDLYNAYDPVTRLRASHLLPEAIGQYYTGKDLPNILTDIELTNLAGINAHFNHEAADKVIGYGMQMLQQSLKESLKLEDGMLFSGGGARLRMLTHGVAPEKIQQAMVTAAAHVESEINHLPIEKLCKKLRIGTNNFSAKDKTDSAGRPLSLQSNFGELPHPRDAAQRGTMLAYAGLELVPKEHISVEPSRYHLQLLELLAEGFAMQPQPETAADRVFAKEDFKGSAIQHRWFAGNTRGEPYSSERLPAKFHLAAESNVRVDGSIARRLLKDSKKAAMLARNDAASPSR